MSEDVGETLLDTTLQLSTYGIVGYDDGKLGTGIASDLAIDATKEITGASAAEEANKIAREQFEADRARLAQQRQDELIADEQEQIRRSRGAGRARSGRGGTASTTGTSGASNETDFLGL